jgi:hypothetical protein
MKTQTKALLLFLFTAIALVLSPTRQLFAETPISASCDSLNLGPGGKQATASRLAEGGLSATLIKLQIDGCKGREVPVDLYAVDARGAEVFMSEQIIIPNYDNCVWAKLSMFIPASRFSNIDPSPNFVAYVRSPDNNQAFINRWTFPFQRAVKLSLIWTISTWTDDIALAGEMGLQIKTKLRAVGQKGKTMKAVVLLENIEGQALTFPDGSRLIVDQFDLVSPYEDTSWDDQTLFIPYKLLAHYYPDSIIVARPGMKLSDGTLVGGNVNINLLAGGSINTVYNTLSAASEELQQVAKNAEDRVRALGAPRESGAK